MVRHQQNQKLRFVHFGFFLDSSMVEHTAVNRGVVGSSPTRGVLLGIIY